MNTMINKLLDTLAIVQLALIEHRITSEEYDIITISILDAIESERNLK